MIESSAPELSGPMPSADSEGVDAKYWIVASDGLELGQCGRGRDREVVAAACCHLTVSLENGRAILRRRVPSGGQAANCRA